MKLGDPPKTHENRDEKWYYCHLCGGGHSAATDLVTNGTFASATTGWTAGNSATLAVATTSGEADGACLSITENGTAEPYAYQTITVVAETAYQLRWWEKKGTAYKYKAYVYDNSNGADITSTAWKEGSTDGWGHYVDFNTPASCTEVIIYLYSNAPANSATTFYFDTVKLLSNSGSSSPQYPESMTAVGPDGYRYCLDHYRWRFDHKAIDDVDIDITDDLE